MEEKRVLFSRRRVLVLLVLLLICALDISRLGSLDYQLEDRQRQEELLAQYSGQPLEEVMADLNVITQDGSYLTMGYSSLYKQVSAIYGFPAYLDDLQQRADNMLKVSIFGGSPQSRANIRKTAADYARLRDVELTLGNDTPVNTVLEHTMSDALLCVYMAVVVYSFLAERKRGLWNMVCACPRGRMGLAGRRLGCLLFAAVLGSVAFTGVEILCAYSIHGGWGELGRMAQSVVALQNFTIPMTIGQMWIFYALLRMVFAFFIGCLCWGLLEAIADRRLIAVGWAAVFGVEYLLLLLPENALPRILNFFTYLRPRNLLLKYQNIPLGDHVAGQLPFLMVAGGILTAGILTAVFLIYHFRKPVDSYGWLDRVLDALRRFFAPLGYNCSLFGHELYKDFITGKGWLILIGALVASSILAQPYVRSESQVPELLESYYRQSQGPIGDETDTYLAMRQQRLADNFARRDELLEQYMAGEISEEDYSIGMFSLTDLDAQAEALDQYAARLEELKQQPGSYMLPHWVYASLLGIEGNQSRMALLISALAVVLLLMAQAGTERRTGMLRTRRATPRGRRDSLLQRHCAAWVLTVCFSAAVWLLYLLQLRGDYGELPWLEAPVRCLSYFGHFSGNLSILGYYLLLVGGRTLAMCLLSSLMLTITEMGAEHGNSN